MKKATRNILIISACCMGAGVLAAAAGLAAGGWFGIQITRDGIRSASSDNEPYILKKTKLDNFSEIKIDIGSEADIELLPSDDNSCCLEYSLDGNGAEPVWDVSDDTLTVSQKGVISGGIFLDMGFQSRLSDPVIRLYLPEGASYSDVDISSDFGNMDISGFSADTLTLNLEYGDLDMKDISAGTADIYLDFGNLDMENITADTSEIYLDYGDLGIKGCSFADAEITAASGNIETQDTSIDTLVLTDNYGDASLQGMTVRSADLTIESGSLYFAASGLETLTGVNEFGDTVFVLSDAEDYAFDLVTEFGEITLSDDIPGRLSLPNTGEMSFTSESSGDKKIEFTAESGDIQIHEK